MCLKLEIAGDPTIVVTDVDYVNSVVFSKTSPFTRSRTIIDFFLPVISALAG